LQATRSLHKLGHRNAIETLLEEYEAGIYRLAAPGAAIAAREQEALAVDCPHCWQKAGEPCIWPETRERNRDAPLDPLDNLGPRATQAGLLPSYEGAVTLTDEQIIETWDKRAWAGNSQDHAVPFARTILALASRQKEAASEAVGCKGKNCGTTTGAHSPECIAEHEAAYSSGGNLDTPGNREPESRYRGYKGTPLDSGASADQRAAWEEGRRAALAAPGAAIAAREQEAKPVEWEKLRENLALAMLGFASREGRKSLEAAEQMLDALADGPMPYLRAESHQEAPVASGEPTLQMLHEMAYLLKLAPRGGSVPVQILDVLRKQFEAAMAVATECNPVGRLYTAAQAAYELLSSGTAVADKDYRVVTELAAALASPSGAGLGGAVASSEAERAAFESHYAKIWKERTSKRESLEELRAVLVTMRDDKGYNNGDGERPAFINNLWEGWQARAALASQPGCAVEGDKS
jgi:hypothetical protein